MIKLFLFIILLSNINAIELFVKNKTDEFHEFDLKENNNLTIKIINELSDSFIIVQIHSISSVDVKFNKTQIDGFDIGFLILNLNSLEFNIATKNNDNRILIALIINSNYGKLIIN